MEPIVLFSTPPNLEILCGITVCVKKVTASVFSTVQPQVIKCRELIFTEPDLIACPTTDLGTCFNVVMQQQVFKIGRIQAKLQKQDMQISKPYRVHPSLYQTCLRYTVLARLAPSWNKAGEWCIQGRDFLVHDGYTNAIKMNLCVNQDEMFISLTGTVVRFPPLQVEDMNLSQQEMIEVHRSTEGKIREVAVSDCWCHVLPSMKRGKIWSLSLTIPSESPFKVYKELKRHWKNMYGYRLPDTDEDILYCQVGFLPSGDGQYFTYPSVCLRPGPVQVIQRVDPKPILTTFLQDIHSKVGSVCGHHLRFQPKIHHTVPSLHNAGQETDKVCLSSKSKPKTAAPLRRIQSMSHLFSESQERKLSVKEKQLNSGNSSGKDHLISNKAANSYISYSSKSPVTAPIQTDELHSQTKDVCAHTPKVQNSDLQGGNVQTSDSGKAVSQRTMEHTMSSQVHSSRQSSEVTVQEKTPQASGTKLIPIFRPKSKLSSAQKMQTLSKNETLAAQKKKSSSFVPLFKDKIKALVKYHGTAQANNNTSSLSESKHCEMEKTNSKKSDSSFSAQSSVPAPKCGVSTAVTHFGKVKPTGPVCSDKIPQTSKPTKSIMNTFRHQSVETTGQSASMKSPITKCKPTNANVHSLTPLPSLTLGDSLTFMSPRTPSASQVLGDNNSDFSNFATPYGVKRKELCSIRGESTPKKQRAKPQIQDLNVEALSRVNQLNKVNAVTLMTWLKDKGVTCRAKDKKTDLIEKVQKFLNITMSEA